MSCELDAVTLLPTREGQRSYCFVASERPDGTVDLDGPHSVGSDLSSTFAILNAINPDTRRYWLIRMEPDQYGTHWPRFEDITAQVKGAGPEGLPGGPMVANLVRAQKGLAPF